MYGIYRLALAVPELRPADIEFNLLHLMENYSRAAAQGASLVLFPRLAITGASCGSLFDQPHLLAAARTAAERFAESTGAVPAVFGLPLQYRGTFVEAIAVAQNGRIAALTAPELPAHAAPEGFADAGTCRFDCGFEFSVGIYGSPAALTTDAMVKLFAGAQAEVPLASRKRDEFFRTVSADGSVAAGVFAGSGESATDIIYGGAAGAAAAGETVLSGTAGFSAQLRFCDFDAEKIIAARLRNNSASIPAEIIRLAPAPEAPDFAYLSNPPRPFLPQDPALLRQFCAETLQIQSQALASRFFRCGAKTLVIGISGGLDSTLALVVLAKLCADCGVDTKNIVAVTMPGFGTTSRTRNNALKLAEVLGATIREIPIAAACTQHFADIGHDGSANAVYENTQARERTQILMDIANQTGGIVVGTGDLSEIALGWCTFNGDHMAMYNVNSSIPKTSIAPLLEFAASGLPPAAGAILRDVIDTPVSPELLPPDENGAIGQKTEAILGAYELHDYLLWHFLNGVSAPEKLLALMKDAFQELYDEAELIRVRDLFFKRFFTQQFKRTAAPDGIQAGPFSLSARCSWQMGADISGNFWRNTAAAKK